MRKMLYILAPLASGCIVVDGEKELPWDDSGLSDGLELEMEEEVEEERPPVAFTLSPANAPPDSTFLAALRTDIELEWDQIVAITAYGDVAVCKMQPIYDELLLTIHVPRDAQEGTVDLVIEYSDGDADFLENALTIDIDADISSAEVEGACD